MSIDIWLFNFSGENIGRCCPNDDQAHDDRFFNTHQPSESIQNYIHNACCERIISESRLDRIQKAVHLKFQPYERWLMITYQRKRGFTFLCEAKTHDKHCSTASEQAHVKTNTFCLFLGTVAYVILGGEDQLNPRNIEILNQISNSHARQYQQSQTYDEGCAERVSRLMLGEMDKIQKIFREMGLNETSSSQWREKMVQLHQKPALLASYQYFLEQTERPVPKAMSITYRQPEPAVKEFMIITQKNKSPKKNVRPRHQTAKKTKHVEKAAVATQKRKSESPLPNAKRYASSPSLQVKKK